MDMDRMARLFLCARCRDQVLLCSHCDRGQQYCSRACSSLSRRERRRETAERYQSSRSGRLKHAARTACWRQRQRSLRQDNAGDVIDKEVTHQGCPHAGADASLLACEPPSAFESSVLTESPSIPDAAWVSAGAVVPFAALVCRRCAHQLRPHVRLGSLRTSSVRPRGSHDHPS
jgi:hypothetical protein